MRASGPYGGVLVALWPLGAYLVYALGTGGVVQMRVALACAYTVIPLLLLASASGAKPGAVLKFLMREHGLRQSDLPEIGSQGVVSEVLAGKRDLNARQIKRLAKRFGVSPAVFI